MSPKSQRYCKKCGSVRWYGDINIWTVEGSPSCFTCREESLQNRWNKTHELPEEANGFFSHTPHGSALKFEDITPEGVDAHRWKGSVEFNRRGIHVEFSIGS